MVHDGMGNLTVIRSFAAGAVLGAVLLAGGGAADAQPPDFGEAVGGVRLALEITPTAWQTGDEITFGGTVENVSRKPIRVAAWGLDLAQALEVTDAAGHVLKHDGGRNATRMMPHDAFPTIAPGESVHLPIWIAWHNPNFEMYWSNQEPKPVWKNHYATLHEDAVGEIE